MTRKTKVDWRRWARSVYPLLEGMSPRQVMSLRRKWIRAVMELGSDWAYLQKKRRQKPRQIVISTPEAAKELAAQLLELAKQPAEAVIDSAANVVRLRRRRAK